MGFILHRADMSAVERERLNAPVSAGSPHQHGLFASWVHPQTVRRIERSVALARPANFAEKLTALRKAQHMMRAVPVAHIEIAIWSEGDICRDKVDRPLGIGAIFAWIPVCPDRFPVKRGFYDLAAI